MDRVRSLLLKRMMNIKSAKKASIADEETERQKYETPRFYVPEG